MFRHGPVAGSTKNHPRRKIHGTDRHEPKGEIMGAVFVSLVLLLLHEKVSSLLVWSEPNDVNLISIKNVVAALSRDGSS